MSCFKSGRNFGRNFCPNPINPVPVGFENSKSGAPLIRSLYAFGKISSTKHQITRHKRHQKVFKTDLRYTLLEL